MAGLAQTLARCGDARHAEALTLWHKSGPHTLDIPRAVASLIIVCICIQLAIGEPEREVAMAMQRDFLLLAILVVAVATPAFGQTAPPSVVPTQTATPSAASVPD